MKSYPSIVRRVLYGCGTAAPIAFDVLIMAPGSRHSYFGHDAWEESAPGLKTLADAVYLREKMLLAFEEAERRRIAIGTQRATHLRDRGGRAYRRGVGGLAGGDRTEGHGA